MMRFFSNRLVFALVCAALLVPPATALDYRTGKEIYVSDDIQEDMVLAASTINFDGNLWGDLIAAGQTVTFDGMMDGSLIAAGMKITIGGEICRSARCVAQTVIIGGSIDGDVVVFCSDMTLASESKVGRDLVIFGGAANLYGDVAGSIRVYAGNVEITGVIDGDVTIRAEGITISPKAVINGSLNYESRNRASIASEAQIAGDVKWKKVTSGSEQSFWSMSIPPPRSAFWSLIFYLGAIALGIILMLLARGMVEKSVAELKSNAVVDGLVGLATFVLLPIFIVLVAISLVGIPLAIIGAATWLFLFFASETIAATLLGLLTIGLFKKEGRISLGWSMILGLTVLAIAYKVPIIGWLSTFVITFVGGGAMIMVLIKSRRAKPAETVSQ